MPSLTEHLSKQQPELFKNATQQQFLADAGNGTLDPQRLTAWLVQDEYYQHAYVQFLGQLMAKLEL